MGEATTASATTREATTAAATTREVTTAAPPWAAATREVTTAAATTREVTTAAPTWAATTREVTTAAPTREVTTVPVVAFRQPFDTLHWRSVCALAGQRSQQSTHNVTKLILNMPGPPQK